METDILAITINASPQKVWNVLTNPQLVKLWQYGSKLITTIEVVKRNSRNTLRIKQQTTNFCSQLF